MNGFNVGDLVLVKREHATYFKEGWAVSRIVKFDRVDPWVDASLVAGELTDRYANKGCNPLCVSFDDLTMIKKGKSEAHTRIEELEATVKKAQEQIQDLKEEI